MTERRRAAITGIVQGVGFRPFVVRLAQQLSLAGYVQNCADSVTLEVEGSPDALDQFAEQLVQCAPANSEVTAISWTSHPPINTTGFDIIDSTPGGEAALATPVDLAPCKDCLAELNDPANRRFRYPFINCVACGPRFSIINLVPFDRANTAMQAFELCGECQREFNDINDRRFHAQCICCPACGPLLEFSAQDRQKVNRGTDALDAAVQSLHAGEIVALKGVGGYQLVVNAKDAGAIAQLRQRKQRPAKPFAILCSDIEQARQFAAINDDEARILSRPAAPILLLRAQGQPLPEAIAPGNPMLGIMLPASPLHTLLAQDFGGPLVVTSGNLHGEPIIADGAEARHKLSAVADGFLSHNRDIVHAVDDSVVQMIYGEAQVLRLARGLAPRSIALPEHHPAHTILCTGGHLKQTPALLSKNQAVCWPQVGDLDSWAARQAMAKSFVTLPRFLNSDAETIATDLHPDYATRIWAERDGRPLLSVQHHHAHVAACLAEHGIDEALGIAWDGSGYGRDGTSWGGEFLAVNSHQCQRVATLRLFSLPGGDAAARNGWRVLAGLCAEAENVPKQIAHKIEPYLALAQNNALCPQSSSVGRLFDAVAALSGLCPKSSFEGQAAMAVQHAATAGAPPYSFDFTNGQLDWRPMLSELFVDRDDPQMLASRFHATLQAMIVTVVETERPRTVALCGGCFQNKLLLEGCHDALTERGYAVIYPQTMPPGDGGLALGQSWVTSHYLTNTARENQVTCV